MSGGGASNDVDPEASLLEKRRDAVRSTWQIVEEGLIGPDFAQPFYDRLFEEYPEVRPMFQGAGGDFDMNEQNNKFFETVGLAVDYLNNNDVESLKPMLEELGRKHAVAWNVRREQYDAVGECLIWTLKTGLKKKDAWNSEVADAWEWAYRTIAQAMADAGEEAREKAQMKMSRKVSFSDGGNGEVSATDKGDESNREKASEEEPLQAMGPTNLPSIHSLVRSGVYMDRNDIELRPRLTALLVVDVQKELSTIDARSPHVEYAKMQFVSMIKNTARLIRKMRANRAKLGDRGGTGSECIFTYCEALTDDSRDVSLDYKLSGPLLAKLPSPSNPAQFVPGIEPIRGKDVCLPKTSCSVFQSTNLDYVLKNLGIEQLVVCGQPTDQSVESAVRDAADRGYLVTVAVDACAAQSEADQERGLAGMRGFSRQLSTDDVIGELSSGEM